MKMPTKKIGDIFLLSGQERARNKILPVMSITMHHGLIDQSEKFKKRVASIDTSNYKIVYENELVVGFPIDEGVIDFQTKYKQAIVSPAYDIWKLKDDKSCNIGFLSRYLRSSIARKIYASKMRGAVARRRSLTKEDFLSIQIPFPSLEDQKRIAAILDKADAVRRKRQETIRLLDEFLRSVFLGMFGDPVRNEKRWPIKNFKELAKIDTKMTTDFDSFANVPHIGIENIEKNTGKLVNYKTVKESFLISGKYIFTSEHVIYSKIRPNLNKVALPNFVGLCSADSYPILVNKKLCNRYFLACIMRSKFFLDFIISLSSRTNIPKVNKEQLNSFECICPPITIQNEYAKIVEKTEKQKELLEKSLAEMDNNFNSLTQRAFQGEL